MESYTLMIEEMREKAAAIWKRMQQKAPLVHCITNIVTVNDCANILLAAGARPTMAHHEAEVQEVTGGCEALVCNLGATENYHAMELAAAESIKEKHPVIIDPVGAGGSSFRREQIEKLLSYGNIAAIRGNASEMRAVFENCRTVTGVDVGMEDLIHPEKLIEAARRFSKQHDCISIISGKKDIITDGNMVLSAANGDKLMSKITGTGCMSSVLLGAAFAVCEKGEYVQAAAAVTSAMGICGEFAAEKCREKQAGLMSFHLYLIDEMSKFSENTLQKHSKIDVFI